MGVGRGPHNEESSLLNSIFFGGGEDGGVRGSGFRILFWAAIDTAVEGLVSPYEARKGCNGLTNGLGFLGTPVVPFFPYRSGLFVLKPDSRKKGHPHY